MGLRDKRKELQVEKAGREERDANPDEQWEYAARNLDKVLVPRDGAARVRRGGTARTCARLDLSPCGRMRAVKLTKAQEEAIRRARADGILLAQGRRRSVKSGHGWVMPRYDRPIPVTTVRKLVELGLMEWDEPPVYEEWRGGGAWQWSARLTSS
jgi:hypothetical protein